jgi:Phosphoglycerate dehydrogenase and related dehydrogenases
MLKLLCTAEFDSDFEKKMSEYVDFKRIGFSISLHPKDRLNEEELIVALKDADIFIVGYERVTEKVLDMLPKLKLILSVRDGPEENIDIAACQKCGIPVLYSSGRCARSVPEHTMLLMLALARPLLWTAAAMREGKWAGSTEDNLQVRRKNESAHELYGKTLGIVGMGRNGQGLAERARAFGMRIMGYDPYVGKVKMAGMGIDIVDLMTLMSESDYISVLARVTEETKGLIGKREIDAMKSTASLINTGRAALVDTDALLDALRNGRIRSAALDVFDKEPPSMDDPVFSIDPDKLLLTPHSAGCSVERITFHSEALNRHLRDYLSGIKTSAVYNQKVFDEPEFAKRGGLLFGNF